MQLLDLAGEIHSRSLMNFKGLKNIHFIFKENGAKLPEWILCLHSSRNETANTFIMPLSPSLSVL